MDHEPGWQIRLVPLILLGKHPEVYSLCSHLKTTTSLHTKHTLGQTFEIGFKGFNTTDVSLQTGVPKMQSYDNLSVAYKWHIIVYEETIFVTTQHSPVLIESLEINTFFSWEDAAEKCHKTGLTLPHCQSQASTQTFVSLLLSKFHTAIFATFIGLMQKAGICKVFYLLILSAGHHRTNKMYLSEWQCIVLL